MKIDGEEITEDNLKWTRQGKTLYLRVRTSSFSEYLGEIIDDAWVPSRFLLEQRPIIHRFVDKYVRKTQPNLSRDTH